jgi:hypothetical protein
MSTSGPTTIRAAARDGRRPSTPVISAGFGFVVYVLAMLAGQVFEVNADAHIETSDESFIGSLHLPEMGIGLFGAAIAVWVANRALSGSMARADRYALGLAIAAALSIVVFWAGWPTILGAVAIGVAYEQRRRIGSSSGLALVAVALGGVAFVFGTALCVLG